jgi:ABC-2 type transport system ATP-binding protein
MDNNVLIKIVDLKKYYDSGKYIIRALNGVSFNIYNGEVIGLLGVNGAGKTTLSSILATLHPATEGDVIFHDKSIYEDINEYRRMIGFCPQDLNLNEDLTVEQNLFFAGEYFGVPKDEIKRRIEEFSDRYDLGVYLDKTPDVLSGGYQRRVMLARALMHKPKLVILDEPTVGLDPNVRHKLWESISGLRKDGVTVILTTHYLDEAEFLSDRICILDKGLIRLIDTPEGLKTTYGKSRLEDVFLQLIHEDEEI